MRQTDRQTDRQTETDRERASERASERERERERESVTGLTFIRDDASCQRVLEGIRECKIRDECMKGW